MSEHHDILIIGAGLAGIGFAREVRDRLPGHGFAVYDMRERLGGTWDFFKYPGLRSDVDMHLYGYSWKPWTGPTGVASAVNIMGYLEEAAEEEGILPHIRFGWKMVGADFDTEVSVWRVRFAGTGAREGETREVTAGWFQYCGGYYSYDRGHRPDFPGEADFRGEIIHPQEWPEGHDVSGKRIVVIGSGATAVTLIPELAKRAEHVTMLQRSPSYIFAGPREPLLTRTLRAVLPPKAAYRAIRAKDLWFDNKRHDMTVNQPEKVKRFIRKRAAKVLPKDYPFDEHFRPAYEPSDQRICFAPDGDFYQAIADGSASVVTDTIDTFVEGGIRLASGEVLEADLIITATGLRMVAFGDNDIRVDGVPYVAPDNVIYRGIMFSGLPNLAMTVGSLVHSYTLRVELIAQWVCRVLARMEELGASTATPVLPDEPMALRPFTEDFNSGYILRALADNPSQGDREPWVNQQAYVDSVRVYNAPLDDGALVFGGAREPVEQKAGKVR